jgi:hypothetical protein
MNTSLAVPALPYPLMHACMQGQKMKMNSVPFTRNIVRILEHRRCRRPQRERMLATFWTHATNPTCLT